MLEPINTSMIRYDGYSNMDDENYLKGHFKKFMKHVETMPEKPEHHADFERRKESLAKLRKEDGLSDENSPTSDKSKSLSGSELEQRDNEDPNQNIE